MDLLPLPNAPYRGGPPPSDRHESVDLYMDTLPTARVRAAGIASMVACAGMLLTTVQVTLFARTLEQWLYFGAPVAALALAYMIVSWGVSAGRMWTVGLGLAAAPVALLVSVRVLFGVSCVGLVDLALAVAAAAFLGGAMRDVRRMSNARTRLSALPAERE